MSEKVLVCILGQTRAHQLTWTNFEKNVLNELNADLALCVRDEQNYEYTNPYFQRALFRWTMPELTDYTEEIDRFRLSLGYHADWRQLLKLCENPYSNFLGGVAGLPGSGGILILSRWYLRNFIIEKELHRHYDRFIITRSDFLYTSPHPCPQALERSSIWLPDGEDSGGLVDRHMVVSNDDVIQSLSALSDILQHSEDWVRAFEARDVAHRSIEGVMQVYFQKTKLNSRVRRFPYIMYLVRGNNDPFTWEEGEFHPELGFYVKYSSEFELANKWKSRFRSRADWIEWAEHRHKRRLTLAVPGLVCASILDQLRVEAPSRLSRVEFGGEKAVEVAVADEVLYVPALHLQVWRNRIVPYEANTDADAFPELQASSRAGEIMAHALFTNVQEWDGDVCVLSNIYSHNFFHFIEELYKIIILERSGFTGRYIFSTFPSRISQDLPKFSIGFLDLLGIERERIVHLTRPTLLRSAWFTTRMSHADTLAYPDVFFALRETLLGAIDGPGLGPRLWLERRHDRAIVNAPEVHECLRRHGFTIVDMSELPIARQIAAAGAAKVLGGPHGAGLVHAMFLSKRSTIIECFSPNYNNPSLFEVYLNMKHRYFQMVQINTPLRPYRHSGEVKVNCTHLKLVLQALDR